MFGLGGGGIKINVEFDPPEGSSKAVPLDHSPSWKVRKNPFALAVKSKMSSASSSQPSSKRSLTGSDVGDNMEIMYAYDVSEEIGGSVILSLPPGKSKADHLGIKIEFVGRIDMSPGVTDGRSHYDFIALTKELTPPGSLITPTLKFPFCFKTVEKPYDSYHGRNVSVRYLVRVLVERKFFPPIVSEREAFVQNIGQEPRVNDPIKMEVGIEDCLHIEFEYEKRWYHLQDVILGKINFLLVKIKIKYMELTVIRRETSGENIAAFLQQTGSSSAASSVQDSGPNILTETQTLTKHEIMDGAPVKGESIPVKLYLGGIPADLTPTYEAKQNNRFSVKYFLNLVLVDEEDRRYFKQQEIFLWRKQLG